MKYKIAIACLLLSFLCCYLEWGQGNATFVAQAEYLILFQRDPSTDTFTHPLILLPFAGQLLGLFALFQKNPNRRLVLISMITMGLLVVMLLLVGMLSKNVKVFASTLPFVWSAWWCAREGKHALRQKD